MSLAVQTTPVCTSVGCLNIANYLIDSLSPNYRTLDPCQNWDEFVCGGFRANHQPDNDYLQASFATDSKAVLDEQLLHLLEAGYKPKNNSFDERLRKSQHKIAKKYYDACMDWHTIVQRGLTVPQELFQWLTGKWKMIKTIKKVAKSGLLLPEQWSEEELDLYSDITRKLAEMDVWVFARYEPVHYQGKNMVAVSPNFNVGLRHIENYENATIVEQYKGWMKTHVSKYILYEIWEDEWAGDIIDRMFELEKDILEALPKPHELSYELREIGMDAFQEIVSNSYLDRAILNHPDEKRYPWGEAIKPEIKSLLLSQPDFWPKLNKILENQPRDIMFLFQVWQAWRQMYDLWEAYYLPEWQDFMRSFDGRKGESRGQMCLNRVRKHLPWIVDFIYINGKYSSQQKEEGYAMLRRIEHEIFSDIDSSAWMDDVSKFEMHLHARDILVSLGYPMVPDVTDASRMDLWAGKIDINIGEGPFTRRMRVGEVKGYHLKDRLIRWWFEWAPNEPAQIGGPRPKLAIADRAEFIPNSNIRTVHAEDYVHLARLQFFRKWMMLSGQNEHKFRKWWDISTNDNFPSYNAEQNHLAIPAGLMHYPKMDVNLPAYVRYGLVGSAMGQGLAQAFGSIANSTKTAELIEQGMWTNNATEGFQNGLDCYNAKYDGYLLTASNGEKVPAAFGSGNALNELISDTLGTKATYEAWKKLQQEKEDKSLPGLEWFTADQLLFLFRSSRYCSNDGPRYLKDTMGAGNAPMQLRTFAPLQELDAWRDAFQCKLPQDTCKVYGNGPQEQDAVSVPEDQVTILQDKNEE